MRSLMHVRGLSTSLPCSSTSRLWFGSISSGDSSKFRFRTLMREQFDEEKIVGLLVCCSRKYVPSIDTHDDLHHEHKQIKPSSITHRNRVLRGSVLPTASTGKRLHLLIHLPLPKGQGYNVISLI